MSNSFKDRLDNLEDIKYNLKNKLIELGVENPGNILAEYPDKIRQIEHETMAEDLLPVMHKYENSVINSQVTYAYYSNGLFIALSSGVGYGTKPPVNFYYYSTNGINWDQGTLPSSANWTSICYGNDKFVATATQTDIYVYSTDGIIWYQGTLPSSGGWVNVTYGNGKFIAITTDGNTAYSTDGITWNQGNTLSTSTGITWSKIRYGNDKFVATATKTDIYAYSTDGITWNQGTLPSSGDWKSLCYGAGKYLIASNSTRYINYSTDGITWVQYSVGTKYSYSIVYAGNNSFVIGNTSYNEVLVLIFKTDNSVDKERFYDTTMDPCYLAYDNNIFVAIDHYFEYNYAYTYDKWLNTYKIKGYEDNIETITWTSANMPTARSWSVLRYLNGYFIAGTWDNIAAVYTSPDGITWTAKVLFSHTSGDVDYVHDIVYGDGKYVAFTSGPTHKAYISTDLNSWSASSYFLSTNRDMGTNTHSTVYSMNKFFVCSFSTIYYSTDANSWSSVEAPFNVNAIASNGNIILIAHVSSKTDQSNYAYSFDGITWTQGILPFTNTTSSYGIQSFSYTVDRFVVTNNTEILFSYDGINWNHYDLPDNRCYFITNYGSVFLAYNSNSYTSYDCITWTALDSTSKVHKDYGYNQFVSYGDKLVSLERLSTNGSTNKKYYYSNELTGVRYKHRGNKLVPSSLIKSIEGFSRDYVEYVNVINNNTDAALKLIDHHNFVCRVIGQYLYIVALPTDYYTSSSASQNDREIRYLNAPTLVNSSLSTYIKGSYKADISHYLGVYKFKVPENLPVSVLITILNYVAGSDVDWTVQIDI